MPASRPNAAVFLALLALSCESMPPSGSPLQPVAPTVSAPAPATAQPVDAPPPPDSPFVEDGPFTEGPDDPDAEPSGADRLLRSQLDRPEAVEPPEPPELTPEPVAVAPVPVVPSWDGVAPLDGMGTWGVTLLATLTDVQPPRAVLALPDGSEQVVQPGTFLPEHRMVVMAVGQDAVQVAHIEPMGFKAKVETTTLRSLFEAE